MYRKASPREQAHLQGMHAHYVEGLREVIRIAEPIEVALASHEKLDEVLAEAREHKNFKRVVCKAGCSACCYLHVSVSRYEAVLLAALIREGDVKVDRAHLERQRGHDSPEKWRELSHEDRRCVFLDDKDNCGVYRHRPAVCRNYMVVDTATLCDTQRHPGATVGFFAYPEAEAIGSASLIVGGCESMSGAVLAALDAEPETDAR